MTRSTLTSKGQVTIPKSVRQALGLKAGDRLAFRVRPDNVAELEPEAVPLLSLAGMLKPRRRGLKISDFKAAIAREALGRHRRRSRR